MSEVPAVPRAAGLTDAATAALQAGGPFARVLPGYEAREGQLAMAAAAASVLERGGVLLAEAGTGTGKTFAYLVPAILSQQRVLVSTGTKNLQEQIFFKDLPVVRDALNLPFTATLMKGRSNYLCLHRFEVYRDGVEGNVSAAGRVINSDDRVLLPIIDEWARRTETGDRAELRELPEDLALWKDIAASAETCLGTTCPQYGECFVTRMRQRAAESDVVIVNHHLLCADAAVRQSAFGEVIPTCATLIVDEAHQLEDAATQYFGLSVGNYRIADLVRDAERILASRPFGDRPVDRGSDPHEEAVRALTRVAERARIFFARLATRTPRSDTRTRYNAETLSDHFEDGVTLTGALEGFEATLALAGTQPSDVASDTHADLSAIAHRTSAVREQLRFLLRANDPDFVYYLETRGPRSSVFLRAAPIDLSSIIKKALFDRMRSTILTSATLAVDGSFDYLRRRLGLCEATEVLVRSDFDYATQAILYLPRRMPSPRSPAFGAAVAREVLAVLSRTEGRAFVLFTSYAVLRAVQEVVEMALPYPVLVQGTAPRFALIERFRSTPHAVLLATSSFWQGVDVPGDALSCVIVDKLPFASPADPVIAARIEAIAERGGDPFSDYQVPLAILALQQGLGRLIRHRSDRGVLAVLDPRLRTMGYGRRFLASLPPAPVTSDLAEIEQFIAESARACPHRVN